MLLHLKNVMRLFLVVVALSVTSVAFGQDQETRIGNPIKREDVLALPTRDRAPRITLERAVKLAERFAKKKRLNLSTCYLFEARLRQDGNFESQAWHLVWVRVRPHVGYDVRLVVSMDGNVKQLGSK
jgi:hypothetical protein